MNPVYKIVQTRLIQLGLPTALIWAAWQKFSGRPLRFRPLEMAVFCAATSANLCSIFIGPWRIGYPRLMTQLPPGRAVGRAVALTFDDGPNPETTPLLLDALRDAGAQATFFVLAPNVVRYPELTRRIASEGHTVALHGARHDAVATWNTPQIEQEIRGALRAMQEVLPEPRFYRPPYGFKSWSVQRAADRMGLQLTTWSVNPKDYTEIAPDEIGRRVLKGVRPGSIILLHDSRPYTAQALPELLKRLHGREFRCVRL